jgi:SAM-dependent methyltransferase
VISDRLLGRRSKVWARCVTRGLPIPRWGNLRRTKPFSSQFGAERGTPLDRHYLDRFLDSHRSAISGTVLEIQMPAYARRFGHEIKRVDTIDINPVFEPTFLCDLAHADIIPSNTYDCFLLPATLQGLRDVGACLREALRVVRPGGVVLATTAGFVPLMGDVPDYWRMSAVGWREVSARVWPQCEVQIRAYGNCLAAAASMMGLAAEELTVEELDALDERYPVVVALACQKPE